MSFGREEWSGRLQSNSVPIQGVGGPICELPFGKTMTIKGNLVMGSGVSILP